MPLYALGAVAPDIHPDAYVHPDAVIIGRVSLGAEASVWPGAVLRGDDGAIVVGPRTSIQDGTVVHCTAALDTVVGAECVVGHVAHLEGCVVHDRALVGSGSIVLHEAEIGVGAIVGANAVVPNKMRVPPGALALGIPATVRDGAASAAAIEAGMRSYVARSARYRAELRRLD